MYLVYKCWESCVGLRYALPRNQHLKKDALVHGDAFVFRLHKDKRFERRGKASCDRMREAIVDSFYSRSAAYVSLNKMATW